jgi:hypothetical protein
LAKRRSILAWGLCRVLSGSVGPQIPNHTLGEAALLALVIWSSEAFVVPYYLGLVLSGAAFALEIVESFIPRNVNIDAVTVGSDGRQL